MYLVLLVSQLTLATLFFLAAVGKVLDSSHFRSALVLSRLPAMTVGPLTIVVPLVEFIIAVGLATSDSLTLVWFSLAAVLLLVVFTLWLGSVYRQGLRIKCGCFGVTKSNVGPGTIARNLLLILLALTTLTLAIRFQNATQAYGIWSLTAVTVCSMCILLIQTFLQARPVLLVSFSGLTKKSEDE